MKRHHHQSGFTVLETTMSVAVTALVVGTAASMTVVTAKLTKSSAASSSSSSLGQVVMQRVLGDIRQSDAVLSYVMIGSTKVNTNNSWLNLRVPSVDTAGRPVAGEFDQVVYYSFTVSGVKSLYRMSIHSSKGSFVWSSLKTEKLARIDLFQMSYFGRQPLATAATTTLTSGEFDGQTVVDPSVTVKAPNLSSAVYADVNLVVKDKAGTQQLFSGAMLRNSAL